MLSSRPDTVGASVYGAEHTLSTAIRWIRAILLFESYYLCNLCSNVHVTQYFCCIGEDKGITVCNNQMAAES